MVTWPYTWFDYSRPEGFEDLVNVISEVFFSGIVKPGVNWRAQCVGGFNTSTRTKVERRAGSRKATEPARTGKKRKI
jgi:hypothetical protein